MTEKENEFKPPLLCKFCVYKDRVDELDAFTTVNKDEMEQHYLIAHNVDLEKNKIQFQKVNENPLKYGIMNWEDKEKPLSKQLMFINGNFPPIRLRLIERKKNDFIELFLPSLPLILEDNNSVSTKVDIPASIIRLEGEGEDQVSIETRYRIKFSFEIDEKANDSPHYFISRGYHNDCMECPMAFNKSFENINDLLANTSDLEQYEKEVLKFKCNLNLCPGIINKYPNKIYVIIQIGDDLYAEKIKEGNSSS